ncbi:cupin domain-containing protein [Thermomonospora umbrina]|uniref:Cupin domain n=1 Tax=Thermomonospora umbrina TaxID=111806 RepID=A0A3D9T153_9ACTN|nr:cupin domain-containing protein [Thermomonospora umbrina]REE97551.1 cupin domain [Thermomonospora umbrina]
MSFMSYPPPRYGGVTGQVSARFRPADTEADLVSGGADAGVTGASLRQRTHYLATGAGTGGEFGLYRVDMPPHGMGPGTHFHRTISESFYVLDGTLRLFDGERWIDAVPGDFLYVPVGGLHAFHNASDAPTSLLLLFAPGAPREGYFEGIAGVADMSDEERREFFLLHDNHWV